jgi:hypothetical protein
MRYAFFVWGMALSDLASPAEASSHADGRCQGFVQAGNRCTLFRAMYVIWRMIRSENRSPPFEIMR